VGSLSAFGSGALYASDWPNWRGPDYNGISKETGWTASKINSNTKPLWKASVGTGFSSIAVSNGRAYTMGNTNNQDTVYCLDAEKGDVIWKHSYRAPLDSGNYEGGPSATPTVADGKVYTISKKGKVFCLDAATGDVIWQKELDVKIPKWGLAGSALVMDNMVIFNAGTRGMALNKDDGSVIWDNGKKAAGYATGVPFTSDGKKCVAMFGANEASGLIAATGKEIWSFKWKTNYDVNAADPIISGDKVFVSSGYNTGCGVFEINNGKAKQVWRNKNIRNHFNSCVLQGGYVYGFDEKTLKCLDFNTGQEKWSKSGLGKGSLMAADGKLIILSEKGKLVIAEVSPSAFKEISSAQILSGKCWTMPVLANGRIYARNAVGDLVCVDVAPSAKPKAKAATATGSNDWPNWRGPEHNGISKETGWVTSKVNSSTKPLWKASVGTGFSSIAVSGGRAYTMGNTGSKDIDEKEHKDIIFCFDAKTGEEKWRYPYPCPLNPKNHEGGPSATPTVEGDRVYTLSKKGHVFCLNAKTGKVIWQKNLKEELGIELPTWDLAGSGLVVKDLLIFNAGTSGIALNKKTGEMVWQNGTGKPGYATAVEFKIGKQKGVAVFGQKALYGINIKDGTKFWEYPWQSHADENNGDPIFMGDKVYVSTLAGCALLKVEGDKVSEVWRNKNMKNHFNSTILVDGYFYGFDMSQLKCLDFNTGEEKWATKDYGKGSLMAADGKLIILSEQGKLVIAEASEKLINPLAQAQILQGKCWTTPVLANGRIYARSNATGQLVCLDVSGGSSSSAAGGGSKIWAQWRGPNRDGKSKETGLLKSWPDTGPELLWSVGDLGGGWSTVSIANGLVYITGMKGKEGVLSAIDLEGNLKWQKPYGPEWARSHPGVRSTPTVDGDSVYIMTGVGTVVCLDASTGSIKWKEDVKEKFNGKTPRWGYAESLLIDGDKLICTPGGEKGSIVALDKRTGRTIWISKNLTEASAFCSPILIRRGSRKLVVTMLAESVVGVDAETGGVLWKDKFKEYQDGIRPNNPITPVYYDGAVYTTSGYDNGGALLALSHDGAKVTRKWVDTTLDTHHGGVVLVDGYIYGSNWKSNRNGDWVCLEWDTGKVMYETKWLGSKGSITYADGMLYCYEEDKGTVALVKASPKGFDIVSSFKVTKGTDEHWAHPVICDGRLYIRHGGTLMAYNVKG